MLIEQQAVIESMPVKEGFGYDHPPLPVPSGFAPSTGAPRAAPASRSGGGGATASASAAAAAAGDKGKRRKTPEYTDSEDEESYESMDEDAVKEALRPAKKHLVRWMPSQLLRNLADDSQKKLKSGTEHLSREEKIAALKECVAGIGSRIDEIVTEKTALGQDGSKWRKHCWV